MKKDYLGIIFLMGGSSYGRASTPEEARDNALRSLMDWAHLADLREAKVVVSTYDVTGHESIAWNARGVYDSDTNEDLHDRHLGHYRITTPDHRVRVTSRSRTYLRKMLEVAKDAELK
jgi:hypothetical protein